MSLPLLGAGPSGAGGGGAPSGTYDTAVAALSPVLYWRLNESAGTTVTDSSGGGLNGTYVGSPTLGATGALTDSTTAVTFNGTSQYAKLTSVPTAAVNNYAIAFWVKLTSVTAGSMMFVRNGSASTGWGIGMGDGAGGNGLALTGLLGGIVWQGSNYTFADTSYHHVVYTREAGAAKIYVDSVAKTVANNGNGPAAPADEFDVGAELTLPSTYGRFAAATIDAVSVHASAITAAQVATLFAAR